MYTGWLFHYLVAHRISVQLPSLLHRRQHARKCCEDCSASVCGYGKHGSLAFHGSGARVLLSGLEKSLLLVPNASAVQKCCSEYSVALRSGSLENSDTSFEALDDHYEDVRSLVTLTTMFSDDSGVQVGFMCSLRLRERHRLLHQTICHTLQLRLLFATLGTPNLDPHGSVSRGSDGNLSNTSVSYSPISSVVCHYGVSNGTHCSADVEMCLYKWSWPLSWSQGLLLVCSLPKVTPSAPCRRALRVSRWSRFRRAKVLPTEAYCLFTSKVGPTDQFDWFMDKIVGSFTSSLDLYSEKLRSLNTSSLWASWRAGRACQDVSVLICD